MISKTLSFAALHFSVAFGVTWALTGDLLVGGLVALAEPLINTVAFYFHERLWQRRGPGLLKLPGSPATLA